MVLRIKVLTFKCLFQDKGYRWVEVFNCYDLLHSKPLRVLNDLLPKLHKQYIF